MPMSVPESPVRMNAEQKRADAPATRRSHSAGEREPAAERDAVHRGDDHLRRLAEVDGEVREQLLTAHADARDGDARRARAACPSP